MSRVGPPHSRIQALLSAYLDDELSRRERAEVEEHLEGCDICSEELRSLRQTVEMLHRLPAVTPRRSFTLRYLPVDERRPWWAWSFPYLRSATAAALALFILAVSGDLAVRQLGFAQSPVAPFLAREAPAAPSEAEGEPAALDLPAEATEPAAEAIAPAAAPEDAVAADRAMEATGEPVEEAPAEGQAGIDALAEEQPGMDMLAEDQPGGEAQGTPIAPEATTPAAEAATPAAATPSPELEPVAPEPAPKPAPAPVVGPQPTIVTLLRWAEVALVGLLIPLGVATVVAWRLSSRGA